MSLRHAMPLLIAVLRGAALFLAVLLSSAILVRQTKVLDKYLIYFPEREMAGTPADVGLAFEDVALTAADGVKLHGWFVPGRGGITLLWFHGNAGNISHRVDNLLLLHERLGASVLMLNYRGYGSSEGSPSERGAYLDAEAALGYLRSRPDVDSTRLVLFGQSLGAAIAVEMAARHQPHAVILEAPFTSVKAMARRTHPVLSALVPVGLVVQSRYDSMTKIGRVHSPVLVMHGDRDEIVPFDMGRKLFDAANEPKRFYAIAGAGHNDGYIAGGNAYFEAIRQFVEEVEIR